MIYPSLSACCLCCRLDLHVAQVTGMDVSDTVSLGHLGADGERLAQDLTVANQELMLVNLITGPQYRCCPSTPAVPLLPQYSSSTAAHSTAHSAAQYRCSLCCLICCSVAAQYRCPVLLPTLLQCCCPVPLPSATPQYCSSDATNCTSAAVHQRVSHRTAVLNVPLTLSVRCCR